MAQADPAKVSMRAKKRGLPQVSSFPFIHKTTGNIINYCSQSCGENGQ